MGKKVLLIQHDWFGGMTGAGGLTYLRRFEHFKGSKCLILLRWTPEGRHYSGVGGAGALAVILGGGWAGSSSFSLFSKRLSSGSGSV